MNLLDIPFVKRVGIRRQDQHVLTLELTEDVHNHLGTVCAGAQYTLAETSSANLLQVLFPHLADTTIPVIRETRIRFRKPAESSVRATATATDDDIEAFRKRFESTGRGIIPVTVQIRDMKDQLTCSGTYTWYIQQRVDPGNQPS